MYTAFIENESIHPKRLVKEVQIENLSLRMTRQYIQKHRSSPSFKSKSKPGSADGVLKF